MSEPRIHKKPEAMYNTVYIIISLVSCGGGGGGGGEPELERAMRNTIRIYQAAAEAVACDAVYSPHSRGKF